jgi:hypothetical protein
MEMARGSSAITAAVHGYLSVQSMSQEQFKITQVKLKANVPKIKPFMVQMHQNLTADAAFRYSFEYIGEYNSEMSAADNVQDKVMEYCRVNGPLPFTRKTLADAKIANSSDDKTLRKTLKWMETKGYLTAVRFTDLPRDKQHTLKDDIQRPNTLVYSATTKLLTSTAETMNKPDEEKIDISDVPF